jgi:hypothetical protein
MKRYRPLDEIYVKESCGKVLPPLPRQILERVKISVQTDTGETENYTVSDSWYNKAIKDKLSVGSQNLDTYYELIHLRCVDAGILPAGHEDINANEVKVLYNYILSITGQDKINAFFEKFVDEGQKAAAIFVSEIDKNEKFNVFDLLSSFYGVKFVYSEDVFKLRPLAAAQKTRGAPGPGEAFIAFFFFSKKPEVGDLSIPAGNKFVEIEIKKQGGRIGKGLNIESGKLGRRLYPNLKTLDTNVLKEFVEFYNLQTVGDILLGNKTFPGITGVRAIPNQNLDQNFFEQSLDYFVKAFSSLEVLQQFIGVIQMKNYFSKIKEFDSILIFTETGLAIGFKREYVLNNSTSDVANNLLAKKVYLKRKTEAGILFDSDGFRIVI